MQQTLTLLTCFVTGSGLLEDEIVAVTTEPPPHEESPSDVKERK